MVSFRIYCISIFDEIFEKIKNIHCLPVGLGNNITNPNWLRDNTLKNISNKNKNYGELTFYYWFWKNELENVSEEEWVGFSQYRRHWKTKLDKQSQNDQNNLFLKEIPEEWENYDAILGEPLNLENIKTMKLLKHAKKIFFKEPKFLLKKNRNLRFNFGMMHGMEFLDKAINQLNYNDRNDFAEYLNDNKSLNPANMFFCKSNKLMNEFFYVLFEWLEKCEKIFGLELKGYGQSRIYAFLCERFLPYWFKKNSKVLEWPILYFDLRKKFNE